MKILVLLGSRSAPAALTRSRVFGARTLDSEIISGGGGRDAQQGGLRRSATVRWRRRETRDPHKALCRLPESVWHAGT